MKKRLTKKATVAFLCILLAVLMLFSGCNGGSSANSFFQSVKEAVNLEKYDFEMKVETEISGQKNTIEINCIHESPELMSLSLSTSSEDMSIDLGNIVLDKDRIYIDISEMSGSSELFDGKDYVYVDIGDLLDAMEDAGTSDTAIELFEDLDGFDKFIKMADIFLDHALDLFEKAAQGVEPAVLNKDGSKFTLTINNENIADFFDNFTNVILDDEEWFRNTLPSELKKLGLDSLAEQVEDSKIIMDQLEEVIDSIPDSFIDSLEDSDFEITAYSDFKSEGKRTWDIGLEFTYESNISMEVDCTIKENNEESVPKIEDDEAVNYYDRLNDIVSDPNSGLLNILGMNNMTPGYYVLSEMSMEDISFTGEELEAMGLDSSMFYIKIEGNGMGEICADGDVEELTYTDTEMKVDGDPASYTYSNGVIIIEQDGASMSFKYDPTFTP